MASITITMCANKINYFSIVKSASILKCTKPNLTITNVEIYSKMSKAFNKLEDYVLDWITIELKH